MVENQREELKPVSDIQAGDDMVLASQGSIDPGGAGVAEGAITSVASFITTSGSASWVSRAKTGLSIIGRFRLFLVGVRSPRGPAIPPASLDLPLLLLGLGIISRSSNPSAMAHVLLPRLGVDWPFTGPLGGCTGSFLLVRTVVSWMSRWRNSNSVVACFSFMTAASRRRWFLASCSAFCFLSLATSAAWSCWALVELDRMMADSPLAEFRSASRA